MPKPYTPNDKLMYKAQREGFRARSVYKLQELDQKFDLLKPGLRVLDIGAAPGSWLQYTAKKIGKTGVAIGIDLQPIKPIAKNVQTLQLDIFNLESIISNLQPTAPFDLVLSDIAPNTTGIPGVDSARSIELCQQVVQITQQLLRPNGSLAMKVFQGSEFERFYKSLRPLFKRVTTVIAEASRDRSKEIYVVCLGKINE